MGLGLGIAPRLRAFANAVRERRVALTVPRLVLRGRRENLAVVFSEPHDMPMSDRLMLYALIRGLKPERYLEIGVRWGGSARIVATAMEANGFGEAVGLDPDLGSFRPRPRELFGRYRSVRGYSPEDTGKAAALVSAPFDMVFIDAVHTYSAVKADLAGVLPFLAEGGHILFHDAFHQGVNGAVDEFLAGDAGFTDLGVMSRDPSVGLPVSYGGLRLIRKGAAPFEGLLAAAHARNGVPAVQLDRAVWDHDVYAEIMGNPLGRPDR